jgi:hypothetical protein
MTLKAVLSFAAKAREFGTDGTATRKAATLGSGSALAKWLKPFEQAVFSAQKKPVFLTMLWKHSLDTTSLT